MCKFYNLTDFLFIFSKNVTVLRVWCNYDGAIDILILSMKCLVTFLFNLITSIYDRFCSLKKMVRPTKHKERTIWVRHDDTSVPCSFEFTFSTDLEIWSVQNIHF